MSFMPKAQVAPIQSEVRRQTYIRCSEIKLPHWSGFSSNHCFHSSTWISQSYSLENCILQDMHFYRTAFCNINARSLSQQTKNRLRSLTFKFCQCFACSPIWNIFFSPQWFIAWKLFFLINRNAMYCIPDYCERLFWGKYVTPLWKSSGRTGQDLAAFFHCSRRRLTMKWKRKGSATWRGISAPLDTTSFLDT